ncbi:MAG: NAD-dependent deacylase [Polyangiaceae bacterium]|nr:NAD-dependent deacylase [Polyangiaceae bacterium]
MADERPVLLRNFSRIVFFTGAGMSAESGVPTYRGKGGIWKQYDYASYACQEAFERDPSRVWEFHNYRRELVGACKPNCGHDAIARAQASCPHVRVVTQNIDGLHQLAGTRDAIELHGSLWRIRCDACGAGQHRRDVPLRDLHCTCGAWWRPDITWFGDRLNVKAVLAAEQALRDCDLLVSIGTSAVVYPAAQLPLVARDAGATLVEVNPEATAMSSLYDACIRSPASEALALMCEGL